MSPETVSNPLKGSLAVQMLGMGAMFRTMSSELARLVDATLTHNQPAIERAGWVFGPLSDDDLERAFRYAREQRLNQAPLSPEQASVERLQRRYKRLARIAARQRGNHP